MKAVLTLLNTAFVANNISVMFEAMLSLSAYFTDHCLVILCKFLGDS